MASKEESEFLKAHLEESALDKKTFKSLKKMPKTPLHNKPNDDRLIKSMLSLDKLENTDKINHGNDNANKNNNYIA